LFRLPGAACRFGLLFALFFVLGPMACASDPQAQGDTLVDPDGGVDWNRYYTSGETGQLLQEFHDLYPGLTELYSIGESLEGRKLWVIEVTSEATGPASEKPALYLDGGIHSGELTASQVALYALAHYLDFCSEILSLTSKLAALYLEGFDDHVVIGAVNEIEGLTSGLMGKIWQKIMILDRMALGS